MVTTGNGGAPNAGLLDLLLASVLRVVAEELDGAIARVESMVGPEAAPKELYDVLERIGRLADEIAGARR